MDVRPDPLHYTLCCGGTLWWDQEAIRFYSSTIGHPLLDLKSWSKRQICVKHANTRRLPVPFCAWRTLSQKENFGSLIVSLVLKVSAKSGPQDRNAQLVITGQSDIHHGVCMKCFRYMFMKCFLAASSDSGGQPDTAGHHQSRSDNDMNLITPYTSHLTPYT